MNKRLFGIIGSALCGVVVVSGLVLMGTQITTQGRGFFFGYLLYSIAILAGGMFITWIPKMHNKGWGLKNVEGKVKFGWRNDEVDVAKNRLIFVPLFTFFFELYGIFDYWGDAHPSGAMDVFSTIFGVLTVLLLFTWVVVFSVKDSKINKNK